MKYVSTRGEAPVLGFDDAVLAGLARDGGLYVADSWPVMRAADIAGLRGLSYADMAVKVIAPYIQGSNVLTLESLNMLIKAAYQTFHHDAIAPLKQIGANDFVMELFHGPTLAFKDFAMQVLGRLFDHLLKARGERVTIVGATSGDTGSAAIEACRDRDAIDIFILHPHQRTSDVQRRQMTTVDSDNVFNIAVEGSFDDCQALVKSMFAHDAFREDVCLSAVNSINWARVLVQTVYYFHAATALGGPDRKVAFSVPTGNFGDIFAGYVAAKMGLPTEKLIVATNENDILTRFFHSGTYQAGTVTPTIAPSMDIMVASNFERLLFDMLGRDAAALRGKMESFKQSGSLSVSDAELAGTNGLFAAARVDEAQTRQTIADIYKTTGEILDPHTAIGVAASKQVDRDQSVPMVTLATAHPAKFPEAVKEATGQHPALPEWMQGLFDKPEYYDVLPNDQAKLEDYIRARARLTRTA